MGRTGKCPFYCSSSSGISYSFLPPVHSPSVLLYVVLAIVVYVLGYLHGKAAVPSPPFPSTASTSPPPKGQIMFVGDLPFKSVNHLPDAQGRFIQKQLLLSTNQIPSLTGFSRAVLKPGQTVERHTHASMHEVFWVESGKGTFLLDDMPTAVGRGWYMHVPPQQPHSIVNSAPASEGEDFVVLYFGIAAD
ncbi:hypothetical protein VYU27_010016 [Nannochloropsis oceanica]